MAVQQIKVSPDDVVRTARAIDADIVRYRDSYTNIYRASDEMVGHWAGKDNKEYTDRLNQYRAELEQMAKLMQDYVVFLDRSAADYRMTQDNVAGSARQLPVN